MTSRKEILKDLGQFILDRGGHLSTREWNFVTEQELGFKKGLVNKAYPATGWYAIQRAALKEVKKEVVKKPEPVKVETSSDLSPLEQLRQKKDG